MKEKQHKNKTKNMSDWQDKKTAFKFEWIFNEEENIRLSEQKEER